MSYRKTLLDALYRSQQLFTDYARQHRAKGPGHEAKAERNEAEAAHIAKVLEEEPWRGDPDMVRAIETLEMATFLCGFAAHLGAKIDPKLFQVERLADFETKLRDAVDNVKHLCERAADQAVELRMVLNDWNALTKAMGARTNGTAVAEAHQLVRRVKELEDQLVPAPTEPEATASRLIQFSEAGAENLYALRSIHGRADIKENEVVAHAVGPDLYRLMRKTPTGLETPFWARYVMSEREAVALLESTCLTKA